MCLRPQAPQTVAADVRPGKSLTGRFSVKLGVTVDRYRRMAILAAVVEQGSIRGAGRALRLTPSAVSQQIRRLEEETGVTLLRSFHVVPEIAADLAAGRLVRVLPDWSMPPVAVAALMPSRRSQPSEVRMAIEALHAHLNPKMSMAADKRSLRPKRKARAAR
jgi:DNA-binding transcriptional LysR family regulator